ncbi:25S rRNA (uridine(2843)-N(3))-methyltransferase [Colletotrichum orbiculare MAFF 240422]|uniref:25S rRNA (Uridine(2843)-N(3))-methyltransferase n=1 Tax=Colletotrichum orbiculare (strain 104-T / ATCC 96160 / CBS 514.97 / LARS 414 / MAFF 240422) TaxID=1213857 RepID=A0A484F9S5_COLOR|nr:25S rRNA (uridine(2843)-N(3))-methyltransferase [Colletotrichum orbiculare MAFF 240422]
MGKYDRKAQSQPKHGKPLSSGSSKAPLPLPRAPPGWNGPGYHHNKKTKPQQQPPARTPTEPRTLKHVLPLELESLMLNAFRTTFPACHDFEALKPTLKVIKDALSSKDLERAFEKPEFLEAYAVRWSPSRALAYAQLMAWICQERPDDACVQQLSGNGRDRQETANVVCFGGGAAEIMAFSGLLRHLQPSAAAGRPAPPPSPEDASKDLHASPISGREPSPALLNLHLIGTADWSSVLSKLHACLETPPTLSNTEDLCAAIGRDPALLTLFFTLNELYTASMVQTTSFLLRMTEATPAGSLLLVVDSPGSYSETNIGNTKDGEEKKKYLMSWLVDYTLAPQPKKKAADGNSEGEEEVSAPAWEKVTAEDNIWYRLRENLEFPVSLENLRLQIHVFKRL